MKNATGILFKYILNIGKKTSCMYTSPTNPRSAKFPDASTDQTKPNLPNLM